MTNLRHPTWDGVTYTIGAGGQPIPAFGSCETEQPNDITAPTVCACGAVRIDWPTGEFSRVVAP
jgi:hypothetical protein